jgi:flagellar motor protein MotB
MQRVAAGVLVALVGVVALTSVGCVDEGKYNAVLLRNREQEKLIQEKESQIATLNERVNALTARSGDINRLLAEKDDAVTAARRERDAIKKAFDDLMALYPKLAEARVGGTGIPREVMVKLEDLAKRYPGILDFDPVTGRLRFVADLTFDSGSNVVKPNAKTALTELGTILASPEARNLKVDIVGHTDTDPVKKPQTIALLKELGKPTNNQGLSDARAESVADVLKTARVEPGRITTKGAGDSQPVADNKTAEGKAKNRRVELFLSGSAGGAGPPPAATPKGPPMPMPLPPLIGGK